MRIRDATIADAPSIARVIASAFGREDEARLVEALDRAGDTVLSLVAEEGAAMVGHVLLSKMSAPFPSLALAPVSAVPDAQKRGVGSALIRAAIGRAKAGGWLAIFVLGDPAYYRRFGFDVDAASSFSSPYTGEHFMALALAGHLPVRTGELHHASAFTALG